MRTTVTPRGETEGAIRDAIRAINEAWRHDRLEDLERLLRPDVVYVAPGFAGRLEGREACIESYREFLGAATVHDFHADEPVVYVFGDAAVAAFRWVIEYSLGGDRRREAGHDLFVFIREDDDWRAAWRTLVMAPSES